MAIYTWKTTPVTINTATQHYCNTAHKNGLQADSNTNTKPKTHPTNKRETMPTKPLCGAQTAYRKLAANGQPEDIQTLQELIYNKTIPSPVAARQAQTIYGVHITDNTIRHHRRGECGYCNNLTPQTTDTPPPPGHDLTPEYQRPENPAELIPTLKPRMEHNENGDITLKDIPLYTPLQLDSDLSPLLLQFGLNPKHYEILRNTFTSWQQSASDGHGGRDIVYLYAAKFRHIQQIEPETTNQETLAQWRTVLTKLGPTPKPTYKPRQGTVGTYSLWPSDLQLGKTRTKEAVQNFQYGITEGLNEAARLLDNGEPVEGIHIGWMGDETEGTHLNYGNQPYVVELNLSEQLELDTDLRLWAIKEALQLGLPLSASSVISNHGEWTRAGNGSKDPTTSRADNSSTHVARQVKRVFDELQAIGGPVIDWTIGSSRDEDPNIILNLSGEHVLASHGYVERGRGASTELRVKNAFENQILGDAHGRQRMQKVRGFITGHYHHEFLISDRNRQFVGLPACESVVASDSYMRAQFGVHSPPGVTGMLVGQYDHRPFRHINIFSRDFYENDGRENLSVMDRLDKTI